MADIDDLKIEPYTAAQAVAILAAGTRAALIDVAGDSDDMRTVCMAVFLQQLTARVRDPRKMANIFKAVADELEARAADDGSNENTQV